MALRAIEVADARFGLDAAGARRIATCLRAVADEGVTVLVATHDPAVAAFCNDSLVFDGPALRHRERPAGALRRGGEPPGRDPSAPDGSE